jgi:hypothetical protein
MARITRATKITFSATGVDLSDYSTPSECPVAAVFHYADKLMTDRSLKTSIPPGDFEIGIANA